jgi:CrcB protein
VGSGLRYVTDNMLPGRLRARFPWGTATVNLIGSLILGIIVGLSTTVLPEPWVTILGTGLIGGYTTFSTASLETVRLLHDRRYRSAALNGLGILIACIALAFAGFAATRWL